MKTEKQLTFDDYLGLGYEGTFGSLGKGGDTISAQTDFPALREVLVLEGTLSKLTDALEEKLYQVKFGEEQVTEAWLAEVTEIAKRLLRQGRAAASHPHRAPQEQKEVAKE